ncbi:MAG TPA: hypothetical protein VGL34_14650 [Steroidobacteraceae bacterium]
MEESGLPSLIEYLRRRADLLFLLLLAFYLWATITSLNLVSASLGAQFGGVRTAIPGIISLACFLPVFTLADFSFGYIVGVVFYGTIAGFIWLSYFTEFEYDHDTARWSSVLALTTFLLCPLFQMWTVRRAFKISIETMDKALTGALVAAVMVLIADIQFGFTIVGMDEAQRLRASVQRPVFLNYVTNNFIHAVLPFAFAFFAQRGHWLKAGTCLIIVASFYPALLNKTVLFAPLWLIYIFLIFRAVAPKRAWVLCLLAPLLLGLILNTAGESTGKLSVFYLINERFFAIPSIALDRYAHFFTSNPHTYFCQINVVRWLTGCPYSKELGSIFADHYRLGNLNASLFATEGAASVGFSWTPIVTLVCGAVLSIGNSVSRHLSPTFVATSSAIAVQALMNVPLSIALLTDGVGTLFILWYLCPDGIRSDQYFSESVMMGAERLPRRVT